MDSKFEKNKFESSISELKKKSFVSAADIESYGKLEVLQLSVKNEGYKIAYVMSAHRTVTNITSTNMMKQNLNVFSFEIANYCCIVNKFFTFPYDKYQTLSLSIIYYFIMHEYEIFYTYIPYSYTNSFVCLLDMVINILI